MSPPCATRWAVQMSSCAGPISPTATLGPRFPTARVCCPSSWTGLFRSMGSCRWMCIFPVVRRTRRGSDRCSSNWSAGIPPSSPVPTSSSAERKKVRPMAQQILIDPVTRIEGHAKITIQLDDAGQVQSARFHVAVFRGFEKFCEGRPLWEMPGITARICGICPVSHLLASAKAGDAILAVTIPPAANKLRRLMNLGQIVQSHALSFFHLSGPDLILGMDSDPVCRNIFGLIAAEPEFARRGIRLRQFGQEIIELLGGKKIHPAWSVPGGVRAGLPEGGREHIRSKLDEAIATAQLALGRFKTLLDRFHEEAISFGDFPSLYMGLVSPEGNWEHYDGKLRFVDSDGQMVADHVDPAAYQDYIGEAVEGDSYLKSPYYKPLGYPQGLYRVGPLARLNVCNHMGVPLAEHELKEFRYRFHGTATSSFLYHYARLIEILAALELIDRLIDDPDLTSDHLRAVAGINCLEGVGV